MRGALFTLRLLILLFGLTFGPLVSAQTQSVDSESVDSATSVVGATSVQPPFVSDATSYLAKYIDQDEPVSYTHLTLPTILLV